ncbi:MAG: hypothetical protein KIT16_12980 [Rhodospirillaceae bacterium]|nr:hypothetical protein [Rhodospirillaceae bacterium]
MLRRSFLAFAALLFLAAPAAAEDDPVALVRELYRVHGEAEKTKQPAWLPPHRDRFFSRRLAGLIAAAYERNAIDFDFIYDGQDYKISELRFMLMRKAGGRATVEARFKNFDLRKRLAYDLVREDEGWRVTDIRALGRNGWVLSKLLTTR